MNKHSIAFPTHPDREHDSDDAVRLESCRQFETIVVRTCQSVYELIVLQGEVGDVLVRGGTKFREFRHVSFIGSAASGTAVKLNTIEVGRRMGFHHDNGLLFTSAVTTIGRH